MSHSIPIGLTREHVLKALSELDAGFNAPFGTPTGYELVYNQKRYTPKAVIGLACRSLIGRILKSDEFSGGEAPGQANYVLRELGFDVVRKIGDSESEDPSIANERKYRLDLWKTIHDIGGPKNVSARSIRDIGVYGGAQGVWVDKNRTEKISDTSNGITVALLHTGSSYADEFTEDCILYHYPSTRRPANRDQSEIDATKAAGSLGLPIFVISYPTRSSKSRDVNLGWVESWDDKSRTFLISFREDIPSSPNNESSDDLPFSLVSDKRVSKREITSRSGQQRFKFQVLKRYHPSCAVCGLDVITLLDAAHICPKLENGSDDPRNGLVLCANHHRAFDVGLFAIEPNKQMICYSSAGPSKTELGITFDSLTHLPKQPHRDALVWHWDFASKRFPGRFKN
jgi:putative restriction endonuclease